MKTEVICEIGKNFIDSTNPPEQNVESCLLKAKRLVFEAKKAGADVAKFQCHIAEDERKKRSESRHLWIQMNENLTPDWFWHKLNTYCNSIGIEMLITPMSKMAAERVSGLVGRWKVSSADIVDFELLEFLKSTGKPIILSTGMSNGKQIDQAVEFLGKQIEFINMCISIYPCPIYKIDLGKILFLKERYNIPIGFSDHSLSIEAPALAVRMGAVAIEKHFCLSRDNSFGPDFKVSLEPDEFKKMVDLIRLAETDGESFEEEKQCWSLFRKK